MEVTSLSGISERIAGKNSESVAEVYFEEYLEKVMK